MDFFKNIQNDINIELTEEFDRNFERKSFFDKPWKKAKLQNSRGSLLMRTGKLRRGNRSEIQGDNIRFSNSMPYAKLQNEGGEIIVTAKMKKFFWAMFYKANGASGGTGEHARRMSVEAAQWKALALKKIGSKMKVEQRQFIGWHPSLNGAIKNIVDENMKDLEIYIKNQFKK